MFDVLVIGAGYAGAVMAERAARELGLRVLIVEKRAHLAGNAHDFHDEHGILVHHYGPHIFHTNSEQVYTYLSDFTDWHPYEHRVRAVIDGKEVPVPFNLDSLHQLLPGARAATLESKLLDTYGEGSHVPVLDLRRSADGELRELGELVYDKVFRGYTVKQWGLAPEDLDPSVTARVPIRVSRDDRYFQDTFQVMPRRGYTTMFERMLAHPKISVMLQTDIRDVARFDEEAKRIEVFGRPFRGPVIYTGMVDDLFGFDLGELPYRSLEFEFSTHAGHCVQTVAQVNYPNDHDYTRTTEFKHMTGQSHARTTVAREYPLPYARGGTRGNVPYYPIPRADNRVLYDRYAERTRAWPNLVLIGRLADYRYFNMDQVVARALMMKKRLAELPRVPASVRPPAIAGETRI